MTREAFRALITDPKTGPMLDGMLRDNARVDATQRRQCPHEYAIVVSCEQGQDVWRCDLCDTTWTAPCRA